MKNPKVMAITLIGLLFVSTSTSAQFGGLKKPKLKKPKLEVKDLKKVADPSGLFFNITDNPSADSHRKNAVKNLKLLTAEMAKSPVDYSLVSKTIKDNDRSLAAIKKLEPMVVSKKYFQKYDPIIAKANSQLKTYGELKQVEKSLKNSNANPEYREISPLKFGASKGRSADVTCYCQAKYEDPVSHKDFTANKAKFEELKGQLPGYKNEAIDNAIANREKCIENGSKYVDWASKGGVEKEINLYNTENKAADPKSVIKKADKYVKALDLMEKDISLNLSDDSKKSIATCKTLVTKVKTDAELYISSGEFQKYLDKMHAEKIAKVFMPKSTAKDAALEAKAKNLILSEEFVKDMKRGYSIDVSPKSVSRTVLYSKDPKYNKTNLGLPKSRTLFVWVAYKDADGKCFKVPVYAVYEYIGGGKYAAAPRIGAEFPEEMACENVSK